MKKSFSLIELIFVVLILTIIGSYINIKIQDNKLNDATNRLLLYLKETRYQALTDKKYRRDDDLWHKKRWTLKFFRCNKNVGALYYTIYSDVNKTGHPSFDESLSDPLTNKKIYSTNRCEIVGNRSKYVLLTKEYNINDIEISCNNTSSLGQISFGNDGKIYSRLSSYENEYKEYEIKKSCTIELKSLKSGSREIIIEPNSAYVYIKK